MKLKPLTAEQAKTIERFKVWLNEKGYSPLSAPIPHPRGVRIGADGLTIPTVSADMPYYLLGRELTRALSLSVKHV